MPSKDTSGVFIHGIGNTVIFAVLLTAMPFLPSGLALILLLLLPAIPALQAIRLRFTMALCFALLGISAISFISEGMMMAAIWLYCTGLGLGLGFKYQLSVAALDDEKRLRLPLTADQVLVPGFCGAMVGTFLLMLLIPGLTGSSMLLSIDTAFDAVAAQMWELPGVDPEIVTRSIEYIESARIIIQQNLVFLVSSLALFVTLLSYSLSRFVLRRIGTSLPDLPGFGYWELPSRIIIVLLITFMPTFMAKEIVSWPLVLLDSLNQLLLLLCALLGLAVVDFFMQRMRWPSWLRLLLRPVLYFTPTMSTVLILIGMLDISFDMRKLRRVVV